MSQALRRTALTVGLAICLLASVPKGMVAQSASPEGGVLRVVSTQPEWQGLDPEASYTQVQFELLRSCLTRSLMGFPGLSNYVGTQPVPDLAAAPPSVSADGMTWTFHLRPDLRYAPPFQNVPITSQDIVRALLRAGDRHELKQDEGNPGWVYLPLIDGFSAYSAGKATSISGLQTPDPRTLVVQETRPDRSLVYVFAMPFTSPIPPSPTDPSAPLGVATGHPWLHGQGYGPYLVASGPYMFEGSQALDLSVVPSQQKPVAGNTPGWDFDHPGTVTLVRDPSWSASSDPLRVAHPDRIEIAFIPKGDPYRMLASGQADLVVGEDPPQEQLDRYTSDPMLQSHVAASPEGVTYYGSVNVAQPPFDDVNVRRAFTTLLDRASLIRLFELTDPGGEVTRLVPDPLDASLLASWDPAGAASDRLRAARADMGASRYGQDGRCVGPCSVAVEIEPRGSMGDAAIAKAEAYFGEVLAELGISARFIVNPGYPHPDPCWDPTRHVAICAIGGWALDYPSAGNMFVPEISASGINSPNPTLLGSSPADLRRWGYATRSVPSIEDDYARCAAVVGWEATTCWARLDQFLVTGLEAIFPVFTPNAVRLSGPRVTSFVLDQAFDEVSFDRVRISTG